MTRRVAAMWLGWLGWLGWLAWASAAHAEGQTGGGGEARGGPAHDVELPDEALVPDLDEIVDLQQQQAEEDEGDLDLDVVVQSASRVPFKLQDAPAIVSVMTGEDLARLGAVTVADALRMVPECDVVRDPFGFWHVAVRGRKADPEVLVLLDGQRLNDFYDGRILYDLPVALIDRIEVIRGPGSAIYGTNAVAGVVAIYTRTGEGGDVYVGLGTGGGEIDRATPASLVAGVYTTAHVGRALEVSLTGQLALSRLARLLVREDDLASNRFGSDGSVQTLSCDPADLTSGMSCPDSAYTRGDSGTFFGTLGLRWRPGLFARGDSLSSVIHVVYQDRAGLIGEYDTFAPDSDLATARLDGSVSYDLPVGGDQLHLALTAGFGVTSVDRLIQVTPDDFELNVGGNFELYPEGQEKRVAFSEIALRDDVRLQFRPHPRNTTTGGVEVEFVDLPSYVLETNFDGSGTRHDELGAYLQSSFKQDGKHRTVLGAYLENVSRLPWNLSLFLGGRVDWYSDFGTAFSPRTGLVWAHGPVHAKLFYGMAFRAPTFQELYDTASVSDLGGYVGNEELDASRVGTLDAGVYYIAGRKDRRLSLGGNVFDSRISASIDRAPLTGLSNPYLNSSDVDAQGAAIEARLKIAGRLLAFANASWFEASSDYAYVNPARGINVQSVSPLRSVPTGRLNVGAFVDVTRRLTLGGSLEYVGERRNNARTPLEDQYRFDYPAFTRVDVSVEVRRVFRGVDLRLYVENLTDARASDEAFHPSRMPDGVPRDRLKAFVVLDWKL